MFIASGSMCCGGADMMYRAASWEDEIKTPGELVDDNKQSTSGDHVVIVLYHFNFGGGGGTSIKRRLSSTRSRRRHTVPPGFKAVWMLHVGGVCLVGFLPAIRHTNKGV